MRWRNMEWPPKAAPTHARHRAARTRVVRPTRKPVEQAGTIPMVSKKVESGLLVSSPRKAGIHYFYIVMDFRLARE